MKRSGPMECHKAAEYISEEIRAAILSIDPKGFIEGCTVEEEYYHLRNKGKPKNIDCEGNYGPGAMHEKFYLFAALWYNCC